MVLVTVLVSAAGLGTPLLVAVEGAQVRYHDDDGLPVGAARAAGRARRMARRGQLVALPTA